tara:strand:- start:246 stop:380 length:135 start_codon:yes stop_codon:yes gene_type:complete
MTITKENKANLERVNTLSRKHKKALKRQTKARFRRAGKKQASDF